MTTANFHRSDSLAFFERARRVAEAPDAQQARQALKPLLEHYFERASEPGLLCQAEKILARACHITPLAPAEAPPQAPPIDWIGGLRVNADTLEAHTRVLSNLATSLMPLVLLHSERARVAQQFVVAAGPDAACKAVLASAAAGLQGICPGRWFDGHVMQTRAQEAVDACHAADTQVLAFASRLSLGCLQALRNHAPAQNRLMEVYSQKFIPAAFGEMVHSMMDSASNASDASDDSPDSADAPLSADEREVVDKLTLWARLTQNYGFLQLLGDIEGDIPSRADHRSLRKYVRLANTTGMTPQLEAQFAFLQTPEGREYAEQRIAIEAASEHDLRRACLNRALNAILADSQALQENPALPAESGDDDAVSEAGSDTPRGSEAAVAARFKRDVEQAGGLVEWLAELLSVSTVDYDHSDSDASEADRREQELPESV